MINSVQLVNDRGAVKVTFKDGRISGTNLENSAVQEWVEEGNTPEAADVPPAPTYQENRVKEYPPIGDQLDALYHAGVFPTAMTASIKAVKDKYPKE
jgi:uncharacterized protein involved in outer membrane biogenesis